MLTRFIYSCKKCHTEAEVRAHWWCLPVCMSLGSVPWTTKGKCGEINVHVPKAVILHAWIFLGSEGPQMACWNLSVPRLMHGVLLGIPCNVLCSSPELFILQSEITILTEFLVSDIAFIFFSTDGILCKYY